MCSVMNTRVACSLCKLAHVVEYLQCIGLFAIGKLIVHLILREFVHAINVVFKNQLQWFKGDAFITRKQGFFY